MGAYINPPNMTKEQWLQENAEMMPDPPHYVDRRTGLAAVCLVHNVEGENTALFTGTAAAIAYSRDEFIRFFRPGDLRDKEWFIAPISKLKEVSRELSLYLEYADLKGEP